MKEGLGSEMLLGFLADGTPLFALSGAEEDDDNGGDDASEKPNPATVFGTNGKKRQSESDDDADDDDDDDDGDGESESDDDHSDEDPKQRRIRILRRENRKRAKREADLQKQLDSVSQRLKEIDDKDKSELEKAQARAQELEEKLSKQAELNKNNAIERAFLRTTGPKGKTYEWHNHEAAMKLLDLNDVEYDSDSGNVDGMKEAVKRLAEEHPYLLKSASSESDGDDEDEKSATPPTGQTFNGKRKSKNDQRRAALEKRFPNLARVGN